MSTDRERIDQLMREAEQAMNDKNVDRAADLYDEAAAINPDVYTEAMMDAVRADDVDRQDQEQRARTREVIRLLDQSYAAFAAGDKDGAQRIADSAIEHNADAFVVIMGGIRIGEIPNPQTDPDAWAAFVAAAA